MLHWSNAAQMAWMTAYARAFQTSCWGRSTRRPALSEPIKLPSEAHIQRWALVSWSGPPLAARLSPHLALFLRQLRPFHQVCSSKCTNARDGSKCRWECSRWLSSQRAGTGGGKVGTSAPEPLPMVAKCSVVIGGTHVVAKVASRVLKTKI